MIIASALSINIVLQGIKGGKAKLESTNTRA
jgi:hypothetical protein